MCFVLFFISKAIEISHFKSFEKSWHVRKGSVCTKVCSAVFFFSPILPFFSFFLIFAFSIKHKSRWQHLTWKNESRNTSAIIPACSVGRFGINCWRTGCVTEVQFPQVRPHLVSSPLFYHVHITYLITPEYFIFNNNSVCSLEQTELKIKVLISL